MFSTLEANSTTPITPPPSAGDRTVGTFAVGSNKNLTSTEDFGPYVDPFGSLRAQSLFLTAQMFGR